MTEWNVQQVRGNGHAPAQTLDDVKRQAAALGFDVHDPRRMDAIQRRRERAVLSEADERSARVARDFRNRKRSVAAVVGNVVLYLSLFTGYLLPSVGVVFLWIVEIVGVYLGVRHWSMPGAADELTAITAVSVYVSLLYVRAGKTHDQPEYKQSFGLWRQNLRYRLGRGRDWRPQERSDVEKLDDNIGALALVIVLLGSVGFFNGNMEAYEVVLGGLARWVLLRVMHYSIDATYAQFMQILPAEEVADFFGVQSVAYTSEAADAAEAAYWRSVIDRETSSRQS